MEMNAFLFDKMNRNVNASKGIKVDSNIFQKIIHVIKLKICKKKYNAYIGSTNKFPPFFYQKLSIYCERTVHNVLFKVMAIASHYFFPSFW